MRTLCPTKQNNKKLIKLCEDVVGGSVRKEEIRDTQGKCKECKAKLSFEYIPIVASG